MKTTCIPILGAVVCVTAILKIKNRDKVANFAPMYVDQYTEIDEKEFAVSEHTINHLSSGNTRLPQMGQLAFHFFDLMPTPLNLVIQSLIACRYR